MKDKRKSFFDIEYGIAESEPPRVEPVKTEETAVKDEGGDGKKFKLIAIIFISAVAVLLVGALILSGMDFIKDSDYGDDGLPEKEESLPIIFEIYSPDWETDIFTLPEYLALSPERISYSDDGGLSTSKGDPDQFERIGGDKLVFLSKYFDAVKRGDHESLNAMLTQDYIDENGLYEDFPMQKLFNISVVRMLYNDPAFDGGEYDDYYFVVSYNIYRNDGLFRADCDDQYTCRTVMRVLMDDEGNGKVDLIRNYYG